MKKDKTDVLTKWNPPRVPTLWEPFREFEKMWDRFFPFFGGRWLEPYFEPEGFFSAWTPSVDIEESDHEYLLRAELPGMKKEEVNVKVEGRTLSISGEREQEKEEKDKRHLRVERTYGAFRRSFTLPEAVLPEKLSAEFKDGVLNIHLPKDESAKPKAIEVKVS
jgi:HSP20 family protein